MAPAREFRCHVHRRDNPGFDPAIGRENCEDDLAEASLTVHGLVAQAARWKLPAMQLCAAFCNSVIAKDEVVAQRAQDDYAQIAERMGARGNLLRLDQVS